jgi:hypothetical protein
MAGKYYDEDKRQRVIKFFKISSGGKLNKNNSNPVYYKNRDASNIWELLTNDIFKNTKLENAPISQKYFHLLHNISPNKIPLQKFVNSKIGYRKGKPHTPVKHIDINNVQGKLLSKDSVLQYLNSSIYDKNGHYVNWINDISKYKQEYIYSILRYTHNLPVDTPFKLRVLCLLGVDVMCPFCNNTKKDITRKTCCSKKCNGRRISKSIINTIANEHYEPHKNRFTNRHSIKSEETGINYRSSWELKFHESNPELLYEHHRFKYEFEGEQRCYISDFTCLETKTIFEIKPEALKTTKLNLAKWQAAKEWCLKNNYTFVILTENDLNL